MFKKIKATVIIILICSPVVFSQESAVNANNLKLRAISFNYGGISPAMGVTYERVLSDKISFELGFGIPSIGIGVKFFPFKIKEQRALFHVGLSAVHFFPTDFWFSKQNIIYLPVGLSYYGEKGFNIGVEIGPGRLKEANRSASAVMIPYGSIRFGIRF